MGNSAPKKETVEIFLPVEPGSDVEDIVDSFSEPLELAVLISTCGSVRSRAGCESDTIVRTEVMSPVDGVASVQEGGEFELKILRVSLIT